MDKKLDKGASGKVAGKDGGAKSTGGKPSGLSAFTGAPAKGVGKPVAGKSKG